MVSLSNIQEAKFKLSSVLKPTGLIFSDFFSEFFGKKVYFKPENLQITGSFKARGAYFQMAKLFEGHSARKVRVICASAGNHSQGVAWAGKKFGFEVIAVMPRPTPMVKIEAVKKLGAKVILCGETIEQAAVRAKAEGEDYYFIHPYDNEAIIAGQGTIGLEIFEELPGVGAVIVPVGGGGLISGLSLALRESAGIKNLKVPKIIGVRSCSKIAEGVLVKEPGEITKALIDKYVDQIALVEEEEITSAILMLMEKSKLIVEGAGAVGVAALLSGKIKKVKEPVVVVLSGGNIDINLVGKIIRKGLHTLGRMIYIAVRVEDRPGALNKLTALLAAEGANIYQIIHERSLPDMSLTASEVKIVLEVWDKKHSLDIVAKLRMNGYQVEILK